METRNKVLVTGCAGFIGFHLSNKLCDLGYQVHGIDNFSRGTKDYKFNKLLKRDNFKFLQGDLTSSSFVDSLDLDYLYVFHLAAVNGTQNFYQIPYQVSVNSSIPTWRLIEKYKDSSTLARFIFAGTPESYSSTVEVGLAQIPTPEDVMLSISDPLEPRWSYSAAKTFSESLISSASIEYGTKFTIIRFHNIYGPRMGDKHFLPDFIARALDGEFSLWGGDETRSFLHVEDAVEMTIKIALLEGSINQIFNVGSSEEKSILSVARSVLDIMGIDSPINNYPGKPGSVSRRCADMTKTNKLLEYAPPTISLEDGITDLISEIKHEA